MGLIKEKTQSDKDFSGLDFINKDFKDVDFHESVFNGAHFKNVKFLNCNLQHTEFTEAKFTDCTFIDSNLNYSDFVYTQISNVTFTKCSFSHVEWRENGFNNIKLQECSFYNSTISLCTFNISNFDSTSSDNFCGASKRYNVFTNTNFALNGEKIEFLKNNYGIILENGLAKFNLDKDYKKEFFLTLSILKYSNQLNTLTFIDLVLKAAEDLINLNQKNRIQRIKYLSLICKLSIEENIISIFGQQYLVNEFNELSKKIKDTAIFMEMVNLIMFIKTNEHKNVNLISEDIKEIEPRFSDKTTLKFLLDNTYSKKEVIKYFDIMTVFLEVPKSSFKLLSYSKGSTIMEVVFSVGMKLSTLLIFIAFSLSRVNKSLTHLVEIKKNYKKLTSKTKSTKKKIEKEVALMPLSVMSNEGNKYYLQINNVVNKFGKDAFRIDGSGKVNITLDNSYQKRA